MPLTSRSRLIISSVARAIACPPASSVDDAGPRRSRGGSLHALDERVGVGRDERAPARLGDDEARAPTVGDEHAASRRCGPRRELGPRLPRHLREAQRVAREPGLGVVVPGGGQEQRARLLEALLASPRASPVSASLARASGPA